MCQEAENAADEVIDDLNICGHGDYTEHRDAIIAGFDRMLDGNDNVHIAIEGNQLPSLRLLQEDYYDQHMDDDERADLGDSITYCANVPSYIFAD